LQRDRYRQRDSGRAQVRLQLHTLLESWRDRVGDCARPATFRDNAAHAVRGCIVIARLLRQLVACWRRAQARRAALPSFPIREFGKRGSVRRRRSDLLPTATLYRLRGDE